MLCAPTFQGSHKNSNFLSKRLLAQRLLVFAGIPAHLGTGHPISYHRHSRSVLLLRLERVARQTFLCRARVKTIFGGLRDEKRFTGRFYYAPRAWRLRSSVFAQTGSTGSLSGTVLDPKGAVVAGAAVKVVSKATGQEFSSQTTDDGTFTIPTLTAGIYTATVTASGFKQSVVTDIKIDVGKPSSINVELEIGAANEIVTVVGAANCCKRRPQPWALR